MEAAALRYLLQRGHAGAEEAFAGLVAIMHGGWLLPDLDRAILARFPRTTGAIETIIQTLPGERVTS